MSSDQLHDISLILKAVSFVSDKHQHQRRKNKETSPYINHLIAVADILWNIGSVRDIPVIVAGLLHDTLEDTDTTVEELEESFGFEICSIVREVSDDKSLPKLERKKLQIEHAADASSEARHIKLADKISNVMDMLEAPPTGWSIDRQREYVEWAEKVVHQIDGTNKKLEQCFYQVCSDVREKLRNCP